MFWFVGKIRGGERGFDEKVVVGLAFSLLPFPLTSPFPFRGFLFMVESVTILGPFFFFPFFSLFFLLFSLFILAILLASFPF